MKVVICDDQIRDIEEIEKYCQEYFALHEIEGEITGVTDADEILKYDPDILILDVEMPKENGIDVKNRLALQGDRPLIIFATNYQDAMSKAFNKNVIGFMVKPIIPEQFANFMDVAISHLSLSRTIHFDDGTTANSGDVIMVTACKGYSDFLLLSGITKDGGKKSLKYWEEKLQPCGFLRIDDGKMVNCKYIKAFLEKEVVVEMGTNSEDVRLKISRRRKNECRAMFLDYCRKNGKYV